MSKEPTFRSCPLFPFTSAMFSPLPMLFFTVLMRILSSKQMEGPTTLAAPLMIRKAKWSAGQSLLLAHLWRGCGGVLMGSLVAPNQLRRLMALPLRSKYVCTMNQEPSSVASSTRSRITPVIRMLREYSEGLSPIPRHPEQGETP